MVKRILFLALIAPYLIIAGEFIATVNQTDVKWGDSVLLNLTLKGTSAKTLPVIEPLKNSFLIYSEQQSSSTTINQGTVTSSTTWRFGLSPQREGELIIPALSIETAEGVLRSEPIVIHVGKGVSTTSSDGFDANGMYVTTQVSKLSPYKNEPIIYTIKIHSKSDLANVQLQKPEINDVIFEMDGDPRVAEKIVNGVNVGTIEFSYHLTPLKAGEIVLPSTAIHGVIPVKRKTQRGSFYEDDMDPFLILQGYNKLQPFQVKTDEIRLNVEVPIGSMNPWLPAKSFQIEELWSDEQTFKVGEPLSRGFVINAIGLKSTQLPNLQDLMRSSDDYKVYADKPEIEDQVKNQELISSRKEVYTIIPKESGVLTLPEITVAWWDVNKKEKILAKIPARVLTIQPLKVDQAEVALVEIKDDTQNIETSSVVVQADPYLYAIIGMLGGLLIAALAVCAVLYKKNRNSKVVNQDQLKSSVKESAKVESDLKFAPPKEEIKKESKKETLPDLNPT